MLPEKLYLLSARTFKATLYCGVVWLALVIALPGVGYSGATSMAGRVLMILSLGLLGTFTLTNLVSLYSGVLAWVRGGGRCPWVIFNGILLLIQVALLLLLV
jgi:hypothetical protein